jgi:hypothetical protein
MGAAASTSNLPAHLDKAAVRSLAGDKFNERQFDAAAKDGLVSREDFLAAAAQLLQEDLRASRLVAESAQLCANSGCAFLCTGLAPKHCCKRCARDPGAHGPKCERKLRLCSRPGCPYSVTGVSSIFCCKLCGSTGEHGPNCWCLTVPTEPDDEQLDRAMAAEAEPPSAPEGGSSADGEAASAFASASAVVAAVAAQAETAAAAVTDLPDVSAGEAVSVDELDADELDALEAVVQANQAEMDSNKAMIEALRKALGAG